MFFLNTSKRYKNVRPQNDIVSSGQERVDDADVEANWGGAV